MKRFVAVVTACILLCYFAVTASSVVSFVVNKPRLKSVSARARAYCGLAILFRTKSPIIGKATQYRFYSAGQWQPWQQLEEPLFKKYEETASLAALKHNRLDNKLTKNIYTIAHTKNIAAMKNSSDYKNFLRHLRYAHCDIAVPDSIEVSYYENHNNADNLRLLLTFKDRL